MKNTIYIKCARERMEQALYEKGVSFAQMRNIYNIHRSRFYACKMPSVSTLYCVAKETGYSVDWMLGLSDKKIRKEEK